MPEPVPNALDLLKRTESLLSALHGSVARHDNLAANLACAGCELRDQIGAVLRTVDAVPAGLVAVPPTTTDRDRIAEILRPHANLGGTPPRYEMPLFDGATPSLPRISGWRPLDEVAAAVLAVLPAGSEDTTTTRADRDSLGREADRLRKDWVAMRTRAEQAEAERDSYGEQLDEAAETIAARTVEVNRLTEELRRLAAEIQPSEAQPEPPPVCEGFQWIGQSFATCDRCGQPAWDHVGEEVPVEGAGLFDNRRTVRPWNPGEADRIRAKWDQPIAASAGVQTDEETNHG